MFRTHIEFRYIFYPKQRKKYLNKRYFLFTYNFIRNILKKNKNLYIYKKC